MDTTDLDDLALLTIPEAVAALRIRSSHFYKLLADSVVRPRRLGHRTLIPRWEIRRLIDEATGRER